MLRDTKRSIYEHVVYDSATERDFADALEKDDDVVLYAKLPGWFKVPTRWAATTPTGPCWSTRTAPGACTSWSRPRAACSPMTCTKESAKIECGKAHFSPGRRRQPARATWWRGSLEMT